MRRAVEHLNAIKANIADDDRDAHDELQQKIDEQIAILKNNSINYLINMHPKFYRESLVFDDWDSSANFLDEKREEAFNFWKHNHDW